MKIKCFKIFVFLLALFLTQFSFSQTLVGQLSDAEILKIKSEILETRHLHNVIHTESKAVVINSNLAFITGIVEDVRTSRDKKSFQKKSFTDVYINVNGVWKSDLFEYHVIK